MKLTHQDWQRRFEQQAGWTRSIRQYLYQHVDVRSTRRVLDVGCGCGALLPELLSHSRGKVHGLDLNPHFLKLAKDQSPAAAYCRADAHQLPYASDCFDLSLCHFLLLWVFEPPAVLAEMLRVTRPGGFVLALAEPDYGGRIDHPEPLGELGRLQATALRSQGADPEIGRRLAGLFSEAGYKNIMIGVLGGQWTPGEVLYGFSDEWKIIEADLGDRLSDDKIRQYYQLDLAARKAGKRILFVPTFYALGQVPG